VGGNAIASVCPSICLPVHLSSLCLLNWLTFGLDLSHVWVIAMACRGLKLKVAGTGQGQDTVGLSSILNRGQFSNYYMNSVIMCECHRSKFIRKVDCIRAMTLVWRLRGKIVRTVPSCITYDSCAQWYTHVWTLVWEVMQSPLFVRPSVCLSVCFHSVFRIDWPLALIFRSLVWSFLFLFVSLIFALYFV